MMHKISRREALAGMFGTTAAFSIPATSIGQSTATPDVTNGIKSAEYMFSWVDLP